MTAREPFTVASGQDAEAADLVAVLSSTYGRPFTEEWFAWKHREGPWGPSRCWVAMDDGGLLGLMFGLPWVYEAGGVTVPGARLVDGGSTPRARGRGVFRGVVAQELALWDPATSPGILVATATPDAQSAHVKNGAIALSPIDNAYSPIVVRRKARLTTGDAVLDGYAAARCPRLSTRWDSASLRWRTDARAGYKYEAAALADAEDANGVIYRVTSVRGLRVLVLLLTWGSTGEVRRLIGAVAKRSGARAILGPAGEGAAARPVGAWIRRGTALLCVWRRTELTTPDPDVRAGWSLSGADLEGVL